MTYHCRFYIIISFNYEILELCVSRDSWEGDDVAYVFDAGHEHDQSLKTEAEASVRDRAVPPEVRIPPNVLRIETALDTPLL